MAVLLQVTRLSECFITDALLSRVYKTVSLQVASQSESFLTDATLIIFLPGVQERMLLQVAS